MAGWGCITFSRQAYDEIISNPDTSHLVMSFDLKESVLKEDTVQLNGYTDSDEISFRDLDLEEYLKAHNEPFDIHLDGTYDGGPMQGEFRPGFNVVKLHLYSDGYTAEKIKNIMARYNMATVRCMNLTEKYEELLNTLDDLCEKLSPKVVALEEAIRNRQSKKKEQPSMAR